MKRSYRYVLFPIAGILFCLWYVCSATSDVVYSDYIRLINSYLPDVWNPDKFFVADIFTRIPINFLSRGINVTWFGFSVRFDQILGILSQRFQQGQFCSPCVFLYGTGIAYHVNP